MRGRSPTLLVDGGDAFFGPPTIKAKLPAHERAEFRKARAVLHSYNYMGYQAVGLGPNSIQFGVDKLEAFLKDAKFPVICANLVEKSTGKPVFNRSWIIEESGVRFGVYGVILDKLHRGYRKRVLGEKYTILDPIETTRRIVPELRKQCDIVIGLSNLHKSDNFKIAQTIKGIDALIDPYSQAGNKSIWILSGEYLVDKWDAPVLRIDGQGSRVGVFEMLFSGESKEYTYQAYDYPLEPQIFSHPELADLVSKIEKGSMKTPVVDSNPQEVRLLSDLFLGEEICGGCHTEQYDFWKATSHKTAYDSLEKNKDHLKYECIECHSVGYGVAFVDLAEVGDFKGVQCESCHGVNPDHAENPKKHRLEKVNDTACWGCHNDKITGKDFFYEEALKKAACPKMVE